MFAPKQVFLATLVVFALTASAASAQQSASFLSIPASAFTSRQVLGVAGYDGNESGTARFFGNNNFVMFAPVHLPHRARVTSLSCGGRAPSNQIQIIFTLRRNQPQQANVDMATTSTDFAQTGFQFVSTTSIVRPVINNQRFNYYLVALARHFDVGLCPSCSVGFCSIGYTGP